MFAKGCCDPVRVQRRGEFPESMQCSGNALPCDPCHLLIGVQSNSWVISIAEAGVKIAFAIGHFILYRKTRDGEKQRLADGVGGAVTGLLEDAF